jgi:hypothetical protein
MATSEASAIWAQKVDNNVDINSAYDTPPVHKKDEKDFRERNIGVTERKEAEEME